MQNKNGQTSIPRRHIALLAFEGAEVLDICGPLDVFSMTNLWLCNRDINPNAPYAEPVYSISILAREAGPFATSSGIRLVADQAFRDVGGELDTLLVAGGHDLAGALGDEALLAWLGGAVTRVRRTASVCTAAFLLAKAGVLDGRRATTHWYACGRLAAEYPKVRVEADRIFVRDGAVYTSGGVTSGIDLALALVEEDWGRDIAATVARWMVVFLRRPGGQSQFSVYAAPEAKTRTDFRELQAWIMDNPTANLSVEALAERMAMSPRNFARVFGKEVGMTPAKFVELTRLELARYQMEQTGLPVETIAGQCGFGNLEHLRRAFQRQFKVSPQEYRARFRSTEPSDAGVQRGLDRRTGIRRPWQRRRLAAQ